VSRIALACAVVLIGRVATAIEATSPPPFYDTFLPPAVGTSYVDPAFGISIKRLSNAMYMSNNAAGGGLTSVSTEYSTASPWNRDNTWLILQHFSYFGLYDGTGNYVRDLPYAVHASSEPRWSRSEANVLFFVNGNKLMKVDVVSGATTLVKAFSEYGSISGKGESDISADGDHFVFAGDNRYVFVYEISTAIKGQVLDTAGRAFDQLYVATNGSVAVGWIANGASRFQGVELFDRNMTFQRQLTHAIGHMRLTHDTNGDDVLIWTNSNDAQPIANCQNGIVKVRLADARQTCLIELDWSLAVHITAADGDGWAIVETYAPNEASAWAPYTNEILRVKLDGTESRRLLHHRSRPVNSYEYQPRASVSRDGTRLVFTSNYNLQRLFGYPKLYTDAYLAMLPTLTPPEVSIGDASTTEGQSGASLLALTVKLSFASHLPVTVSYATSNGTASSGSDYTATSGTMVMPAGSTSQQVMVLLHGDTTVEASETFTVTLSSPANATLGKSAGTATIVNDDPANLATTVTQYRLYHGGTLEHLYTTDANEYDVLGTAGWVREGIAYRLLTSGTYKGVATVPLFRLYHPGIRQHHWTSDANEALTLPRTTAWVFEGTVGYLLPTPVSGAIPLYRMALANPPLHLWTTDKNEYDTLETRGWTKEGIVGYVIP
jgi:hypothetical protein